MADGPNLLSMAVSTLYALAVLACAGAFFTSAKFRQQNWHKTVWLCLALLFVGLIAWRLTGAEEYLRDTIRGWMREQGQYDDRRTYQRPVAAAVVALVFAVIAWQFFRFGRGLQGRRNFAAIAGAASGGAMILLVTLRMISLSPIDKLLYGLKLNWLVDTGSTVAAIAASLFYISLVRKRP